MLVYETRKCDRRIIADARQGRQNTRAAATSTSFCLSQPFFLTRVFLGRHHRHARYANGESQGQ